jgi:hypothetical protein
MFFQHIKPMQETLHWEGGWSVSPLPNLTSLSLCGNKMKNISTVDILFGGPAEFDARHLSPKHHFDRRGFEHCLLTLKLARK